MQHAPGRKESCCTYVKVQNVARISRAEVILFDGSRFLC